MATANVLLLDVQPRLSASGSRVTLRLGGGGADYPLRYGGNQYAAGISSIPAIIAALVYDGTDMGQGAVPQALQINFAWPTATQSDAQAYNWKGAPFAIYFGPENAAGTLPPLLLTGTVLAATIADSIVQLAMADPAADLQRAVVLDTFAGTGGIEGPADWQGNVKRRAWGYVFNVEGFCIDTANNVYSFSDPARPLNAISDVRDKGASLAPLSVVPWQGSVAATFALLQIQSVPAGYYAPCPSIGMVKTWTRPAGVLCADLQGEAHPVTGSFVYAPAAIADAIVATRGGPNFVSGSVTAATALRNVPAGVLVDDLQTTIAQTLDYVLGGSSLFWVLDPTGIRIGEWTFGASQGSFLSDSVDRTAVLPPLKRRSIGYRKNNRPLAAGDLAAILTYGDGTPLDNLQPAEAGANVTAAHTAAGIAGQGSLATLNSANWATQVIGRPTELTDGRILAGLDSAGYNVAGFNAAGYLFGVREALAGIGGTNIAPNPEFAGGSGVGWALYNNAGGTAVSIAVTADAAAPNGSGYVLGITYTPGSSGAAPGYGGAVQSLTDGGGAAKPGYYARGTTVIWRIIAKIPVGRSLYYASNQIGDDASFSWLTDQAGTGAWQTYQLRMKVGTTGTFSSTGHLYVGGGADATFSWAIAKQDFIDCSSALKTFMGAGGLYDETGTPRFRVDLLTSAGVAAAIAGQGTLATLNGVTYGTGQVIGFGALSGLSYVYLGDGKIRRSDGVTTLTESLVVTSAGTAAGIAGQGSLATLNAADWTSQITGSGKPANYADVTASNTAAGIAGQGSLATLSAADWATQVTGTNKPNNNAGKVVDTRATDATPGAYYTLGFGEYQEFKNAGFSGSGSSGYGHLLTVVQYPDISGGPVKQYLTDSNGAVWYRLSVSTSAWGSWAVDYNAANKPAFGDGIVETPGGAVAALAAFKTGLGTAAAITGQGSLATLNSANWSTQVAGTGKPADNADVTSANTAAGISGQGALATLNTLPGSLVDNNTVVASKFTADQGVDLASVVPGSINFRIGFSNTATRGPYGFGQAANTFDTGVVAISGTGAVTTSTIISTAPRTDLNTTGSPTANSITLEAYYRINGGNWVPMGSQTNAQVAAGTYTNNSADIPDVSPTSSGTIQFGYREYGSYSGSGNYSSLGRYLAFKVVNWK